MKGKENSCKRKKSELISPQINRNIKGKPGKVKC